MLEKLKTPLETLETMKGDTNQQCHMVVDPQGHKPLGMSVRGYLNWVAE